MLPICMPVIGAFTVPVMWTTAGRPERAKYASPSVADRRPHGALAPGRVVVPEDRVPGGSVAVLPGQVVQRDRHHPVYDGLVVVLGQVPAVARRVDDAVLVDRGGIMDPDHPARVYALGLAHRLIRGEHRGRIDLLGAVGRRMGDSRPEKCSGAYHC